MQHTRTHTLIATNGCGGHGRTAGTRADAPGPAVPRMHAGHVQAVHVAVTTHAILRTRACRHTAHGPANEEVLQRSACAVPWGMGGRAPVWLARRLARDRLVRAEPARVRRVLVTVQDRLPPAPPVSTGRAGKRPRAKSGGGRGLGAVRVAHLDLADVRGRLDLARDA